MTPTTPPAIPSDIWAEADELRMRVFNAMHDDDGRLTDNDPADIIARALLAAQERGKLMERERCAGIAETMTQSPTWTNDWGTRFAAPVKGGAYIAAAIRKGVE